MTRTITIDGKEVTFRASAAIPRMYRMKFKRDIMQDVRDIDKATKKAGEESISPALLEAFENMAFLMETFSIYEIFPVIVDLWSANMQTLATSKKN